MDIWSTTTGALVYQMRFDFYSSGISLSPDNKYLAVGNAGKATIFDFAPIMEFSGSPVPQITSPQITPTPQIFAWPTPTAVPTSAEPSNAAFDSAVIDSVSAAKVQEKNRFNKGAIEQISWTKNDDAIVITGALGVSEYRVDSIDGNLIVVLKENMTDGHITQSHCLMVVFFRRWSNLAEFM